MANKKQIRIGLIGCGLMGRTHSNGYKRIGDFFPELQYRPVLKAVCSRREDKVKAFAEQWGYESYTTNWKDLIARDDIDAIDICTPNDTHAEIAVAAAAAGKMILCEKPLVIFQFLVVKPNEHQIPEVYSLANDLGVDQVDRKAHV